MKTSDLPNLKYDFSQQSKGRLRTYHLLMEELERQELEEREDDVIALDDDILSYVAAAGILRPDGPRKPTDLG